MSDTIYREDAIKAVKSSIADGWGRISPVDACQNIRCLPSADRPKHYCAECKFEPIDKRCMPCSSCTNNPKNRDAFVSCEVEKKGADDE